MDMLKNLMKSSPGNGGLSEAYKVDMFDKLPHLDSCCYCVIIKVGCIFIALTMSLAGIGSMCNSMVVTGGSTDQILCHYPPPNNCVFKPYIRLIAYVDTFYGMAVLIGSLAFLIGIFVNRIRYATMFLNILAVYIILIILESIVVLALRYSRKNCAMATKNLVICLVTVLTVCLGYSHFIIVVKSYRTLMRACDIAIKSQVFNIPAAPAGLPNIGAPSRAGTPRSPSTPGSRGSPESGITSPAPQ